MVIWFGCLCMNIRVWRWRYNEFGLMVYYDLNIFISVGRKVFSWSLYFNFSIVVILEVMFGFFVGIWNKVLWKWGSNLFFFWGIICLSLCFKKIFCNCVSVIISLSYRFRKCLFFCNFFSGTFCVVCWRIFVIFSRFL